MTIRWGLFTFAMTVDAAFLFMVIGKAREVRRASRWLPAPGKILSSRSEAREVRIILSDDSSKTQTDTRKQTETRHFAAVDFEYSTPLGKLRGNRISIGEDLGLSLVAEKLKLYQAGANVTVYYNPLDQSQCVLERDMPGKAFNIAIALGLAFAFAAIAMLLASGNVLEDWQHYGKTPLQLGLALVAGLAGGLILWQGIKLQGQADRARRWPKARGLVKSCATGTAKGKVPKSGAAASQAPSLRPAKTAYTYRVGEIAYQGERLEYGAQLGALWQVLTRSRVDSLEPGQKVEVSYDPADPASAVLRTEVQGLMLLGAASLTLLGGALQLIGWW